MPTFSISRSCSIAADPALVHRLLSDVHQWPTWSPWDERDPELARTFAGADEGVGSFYSWDGPRAGCGSTEITDANPERVESMLTFSRPVRAVNQSVFSLTPAGGGTEVVWTVTGEQRGLAAWIGRLLPTRPRRVARDFEKGLERLKSAAEQ